MTLRNVTVLLNVDPNKWPNVSLSGAQYCPCVFDGPTFKRVAFFRVATNDDDLTICEITFQSLNAPRPAAYGGLTRNAIELYHRLFPSLSVGDIVMVDGVPYICRDAGFDELEQPTIGGEE